MTMRQPSADENLAALGWGDWQRQALNESNSGANVPARVVRQAGAGVWIDTGNERIAATVAGRLRRAAASAAELPVVGDWVLIPEPVGTNSDVVMIQRLIPRRTVLMRRRAGGKAEAQLLGANIDIALIVWALDREPNTALLERAVVVARAGGIEPVILLTKADLREGSSKDVQVVRTRLALEVLPVEHAHVDRGTSARS
ncbi:MAG: GTPase RsgA [Polyangiaceae bacterium]